VSQGRKQSYAQKYAYVSFDQTIARVAKVFQFFTQKLEDFWTIGYLVMEHVEGVTFDQLDLERPCQIVKRVGSVLNHVHSFTGTRPGPLDGNEARGLLWSEYGSGQNFELHNGLQDWLNVRLAKVQDKIDISETQLCLCHLDIAPRNLMLGVDGSIYLLDWGAAGFYPRFFEMWSIQLSIHLSGDRFLQELARAIGEPQPEDQIQIVKLNCVFAANQRFAL
jgi:serine/threonine protein kinase